MSDKMKLTLTLDEETFETLIDALDFSMNAIVNTDELKDTDISDLKKLIFITSYVDNEVAGYYHNMLEELESELIEVKADSVKTLFTSLTIH